MEENIQDNGKIIECMVKEFINGKMEGNIKVTILWIRNTEKELTFFLMEKNIKEIGKMESSMEKELK